jgi:hypothetical protein
MSSTKQNRSHVFVSYNHNDVRWVKRLRVHLKPLEKRYGIVVWDYTQIRPGAKWREETENAMDSARVAILLITADFLASDFIRNDELPRLLRAAETDGTVILPIIVSPSTFSQTSLANFQSVNDPSRPLNGLSKEAQEAIFVRVSQVVEHAFSGSSKVDSFEPGQPKQSSSLKKTLLILALVAATGFLAVNAFKFDIRGLGGAASESRLPPQTNVQPRAELSGTVLDSLDQPLQGARITLDDLPGMWPVETSSDGVFNVREIPKAYGEGVRVRVVMHGYHPSPYTEDVVLGKAPPIIKLTKAKTK